MSRHIFCNQLKARSILYYDRERMSRHKIMLFKCTSVATKRNNVATNTLAKSDARANNFVMTK